MTINKTNTKKTMHRTGKGMTIYMPFKLYDEIELMIKTGAYRNKTDFVVIAIRNLLEKESYRIRELQTKTTENQNNDE